MLVAKSLVIEPERKAMVLRAVEVERLSLRSTSKPTAGLQVRCVQPAESGQATAWILERCYGDQFARLKTTTRLEHHHTNAPEAATIHEAGSSLGLM